MQNMLSNPVYHGTFPLITLGDEILWDPFLSHLASVPSALSVYRADSRFVPSQWETSLKSNTVSHWMGANLESALVHKCYLNSRNFHYRYKMVSCCLIFIKKYPHTWKDSFHIEMRPRQRTSNVYLFVQLPILPFICPSLTWVLAHLISNLWSDWLWTWVMCSLWDFPGLIHIWSWVTPLFPAFWLMEYFPTDFFFSSLMPCCFSDHSVYMPSQWEMALHCNAISHWLGTEWSLVVDNFISMEHTDAP